MGAVAGAGVTFLGGIIVVDIGLEAGARAGAGTSMSVQGRAGGIVTIIVIDRTPKGITVTTMTVKEDLQTTEKSRIIAKSQENNNNMNRNKQDKCLTSIIMTAAAMPSRKRRRRGMASSAHRSRTENTRTRQSVVMITWDLIGSYWPPGGRRRNGNDDPVSIRVHGPERMAGAAIIIVTDRGRRGNAHWKRWNEAQGIEIDALAEEES